MFECHVSLVKKNFWNFSHSVGILMPNIKFDEDDENWIRKEEIYNKQK